MERNIISNLKTSGSSGPKGVLYLPDEVVEFTSTMENVLEVYQHSYDDKTTQICPEEMFG